jgi:putative MATE family efflux protein
MTQERSITQAKFVTGSTMRHVLVMTATGSIGLIAVFAVDALNLFYIGQLGQKELAAAVGYSGTILFFYTSIGIGLSIAATAMVARALGQGERAHARKVAGAALLVSGVALALVALLTLPFFPAILRALGAQGETARLALRFMHIVLPSIPLLGLGMTFGGLLRALGDARRAMYVTLGTGFATAVLDPLFIFGFGMGLDGAAYANVLARLCLIGIGGYSLFKIHRMASWPPAVIFRSEYKTYLQIGIPAILTQIATPVGNTFVTAAISHYGDDAVAGWAVIGRLIPLAFGTIFALSGAVGPILGQNFGAQRYDRLRSTMRDSLIVTVGYVLAVWLLLALASSWIAQAFGTHGLGRELIIFFCVFVSASFVFNGFLFVANAAFNNLGFAFYSTMLNWGRSTLGVIPFVWLGSHWYGALGVLAGYGLGVVLFGVVGVVLCFRVLARLERQGQAAT